MIPVQYIIVAKDKKATISHAKTAIAAGCKWIQLQLKDLQASKAEKTAIEIKELCRKNDAAFIIENDMNLVQAIEADGVHLTDGTSVAEARQILGEGFLIGTNVISAEEIILNKKQSADYLCCGPFSPTSKNDDTQLLNIEDYIHIIETMEENDIALPLSAFGEILPEHIDTILKTGIRGITIQTDGKDDSDKNITDTLIAYINA